MYSGVNQNEEIVSVEFCTYVKIKILKEKNAQLLKEFLDVKCLLEDHNTVLFINDATTLRRY